MTEFNKSAWTVEDNPSAFEDSRMFRSPEALESAVLTLDSQLKRVWDKREIDSQARCIANMSAAAIYTTNNTIFTQKEGERV
jgi:hypothetical protein